MPAADLSPLSVEERKKFEEYLARDSAVKAPAVRVGDAYQVLSPISVPRRGDKDHNDLAMPGETVYLTRDEAEQFMRTGPRAGRRVPPIRPMSEASEPMPRLHPRQLSGRLMGPPEGARADPAGSSAVQVMETVPEANEPALDSETQLPPIADAEDIPPARARRPRTQAEAR
jgi:hypothetical protein